MDPEDQNELLQTTDEEESSEDDDEHYLQIAKTSDSQDTKIQNSVIFNRLEFFITVSAVIVSSTLLTIFLPIYLEIVNKKSNVYVMLQFTTISSALILTITVLVAKKSSSRYASVMFCKPPVSWRNLIKLSLIYTVSGFMIVYSVDQKRVVCHIQDPIKGLVLVFSLVYYFLFSKHLMKLQSIFSTTAIIVGLFISIDYGLCNKFRCRGQDYNQSIDDGSPWTWQTHMLWTTVYIVGLALFSGFYTVLEMQMVPVQPSLQCISRSSFLLTTISCLVSSRDANSARNQIVSEVMPIINPSSKRRPPSSLHIATWLHFLAWIFVSSLFWITFIPGFEKISYEEDFLNVTKTGFLCHFTLSGIFTTSNVNYCSNLSFYGWIFVFSYVAYVLSSIRFLIISQSAVFVFAVTTVSLPLVFIWWSLFHMDMDTLSMLVWTPSLTGELICALLGLPIVLTGLVFLTKWHFKNQENAQQLVDSFQET